MTSCRGILIAGTTNRARTQMAEALLRALTASRVFVTSGGVYYDGVVHPFALRVLHEVGVCETAAQSVSSLSGAQRQCATYDVYVSIDAPYTDAHRRADRYHCRHVPPSSLRGAKDKDEQSSSSSSGDSEDALSAMLTPATPAHWAIARDATDVQQQWRLWSPRNPAILHERSTRKFQDHLYEGEPLFVELTESTLRAHARVRERWQVAEVGTRYAMERSAAQLRRFVAARDDIAVRCVRLLRRLSAHYGEELLVNTALLRQLATHIKALAAEAKTAATTSATTTTMTTNAVQQGSA